MAQNYTDAELESLSQTSQEQPRADEYSDSDLASLAQPSASSALNTSLHQAAGANPDEDLRKVKLAKELDTKPELVTNTQDAELELFRKRVASYDIAKHTGLAKALEDPYTARIAKNSIADLAAVAGKIKNLGGALAAGTFQIGAGIYGGLEAAADILPVPHAVSEELSKIRRGQQAQAEFFRPESTGSVERGIYSGIESVGITAGALAATLASKNPAFLLYAPPAISGGAAYAEAKDEGAAPLKATAYALRNTAIEYWTERLPGLKLLEGATGKTGLMQMSREFLAREIPGEQIATHLQDLDRWVTLHPEGTFKDYWDSRPAAAVETFVATIAGGGAQIGVAKGLGYIATREERRAERAIDDFKKLSEINDAYAKEPLRTKAPEQFKNIISKMTEDDDMPDAVWVDAKTFVDAVHTSGLNMAELKSAMPEVFNGLDEALQNTSDIRIPMADYAAHIAGSGLDTSLLDHIKVNPDGMTYAQSRVFMEEEKPRMEAEAAKIVTAGPVLSREEFESRQADLERIVAQAVESDRRVQEPSGDAFRQAVGERIAAQEAAGGGEPVTREEIQQIIASLRKIQEEGGDIKTEAQRRAEILTPEQELIEQTGEAQPADRRKDIARRTYVAEQLAKQVEVSGGIAPTREEIQAEVERSAALRIPQQGTAKQTYEEYLAEHANKTAAAVAEINYVKSAIIEQLKQTGRFTDTVAAANAEPVIQFFVTMAKRLGTTPSRLYARFPLRIQAEGAGRGYRQAPVSLAPGEDLVGLPTTFDVAGETKDFHSFQIARDAAEKYMKDNGLGYMPVTTYAKLDKNRSAKIAAEFDKMKHDPQDPKVKAAYEALAKETLAQWEAVKATGLKVEFITGEDPYPNPRMAILDIVENNHLWVFPTTAGFGEKVSGAKAVSDNPLLQVVPGETISGREVQLNDIFRIVHDYFGHAKEGVGFRAEGEENAWRIHSSMFSDLARKALTTETRGQNSWLNFGPYGEQNRAAVSAETRYAPQKTGLLPGWVSNDGVRDGLTVTGVHFSKQQREFLDGAKYGTGIKGAEGERLKEAEDNRIKTRIAFYIDEGRGVKPEVGLGQVRHDVPLTNLYDAKANVLKLPTADKNEFESAILNAGFSGYYMRGAFPTQGAAVLLGDSARRVPVQPGTYAQEDISDLGFYSPLSRAVASAKQSVATGSDWKNIIKSLPGVKNAEIEALGINEWLEFSSTDQVTREEIIAFIASNGVQLEEVVLGLTTQKEMEIERLVAQRIEQALDENIDEILRNFDAGYFVSQDSDGEYIVLDNSDNIVAGPFDTEEESFSAERELIDEAEREHLDRARDMVDEDAIREEVMDLHELPKYEDYTLPGGENYREVLLTIHSIAPIFHAGHFDEGNIVTHVRIKDRRDQNQGKVLFIEEIQSDWGQAGREKGFGMPSGYEAVFPAAPFITNTKEWTALALKRMIRYAAENGYDSIAWTTGEQQANRYNLSKSIDSINWSKIGDGVYAVSVEKDGKNLYIFDGKAVKEMDSTELTNTFGKSIAESITSNKNDAGEVSGEGLKVGGSGMKSYYDSIVPQVATYVLKKLGVKGDLFGGGLIQGIKLPVENRYKIIRYGKEYRIVDTHKNSRSVSAHYTLEAADKDARELNNADPMIQQGFEITPELRSLAMAGMPLFQGNRGEYSPSNITISLLKGADLSTFIHESGHFYLDALASMARSSNAPKEVVEDFNKVLDWFGIQSDVRKPAKPISEYESGIMDFNGLKLRGLVSGITDADLSITAKSAFLRYVVKDTIFKLPLSEVEIPLPAAADQSLIDKNADKIASEGSLEPISVGVRKDGSLFVIEGHYQALALQKLGHDSIPAIVIVDESAGKVEQPQSAVDKWDAMSADEKREYHEQWAESYERYTLEGKAPSSEMQPIFSRFRAWLTSVYQSMERFLQLNPRAGKLNDEIRAVFSRMLASRDAIQDMEQRRGHESLFKSAEEAGISKAEYDAYLDVGGLASESAISEMQARSLKDMKWLSNAKNKKIKALQKEADAKRDAIKEIVTAEVMAEPINQARTALKDKEAGLKIHTGLLKEMLPDLDVSLLRGMTNAETGVNPDQLADMFGFDSGLSFINELVDGEKPNDKIQAITDQRMLEQHGDLIDLRAIEQAANAAVHNEGRARFMAAGLRILTKSTIPVKDLVNAAKQSAKRAIDGKKIRDIHVAQYEAAESRANKEAIKKAAKDPSAAIQAQRAALLNNRLVKTATDALDDVEKGVARMQRLQKSAAQGNMRGDFLEQLNTLLDRFDVRKSRSLKDIDADHVPLEKWLEQESERLSAVTPTIPPWILNEGTRRHYKDLTVSEFRELMDAIKGLEMLARREEKQYQEIRGMEFAEERKAVLDRMRNVHPEAFDVEGQPKEMILDFIPKLADAKALGEEFRGEFLNAETIISMLEGGEFGQINESLFGRLSAGVDAKATKMAELAKTLKPRFDAYDLKERIEFSRKAIGVINGSAITRENAVVIALLHGSTDGRERLANYGWTEGQQLDAVSLLDNRDLDLVEGIWNVFDKVLWPELKALNERTRGKAPPKIAASSYQVKGRTMKGGYFKLKYDAKLDPEIQRYDEVNSVKGLLGGTFGKGAKTAQGSSTERKEGVTKRPRLTLDTFSEAINETVHDLALREAVADTMRLLNDKGIRNAIQITAGDASYQALITRVREVAAPPHNPSGFIEKSLSIARRNTVTTLMSGLGTAIQNVTGFSGAASRVSAGRLAKEIATFYGPKMKDRTAFVYEHSEYMRNRYGNYDRDLQDAAKKLTVNGRILPDTATMLWFMSQVDKGVSVPVWLAAFGDGMSKFENDTKKSIAYADHTVRQTQGSGRDVDLSAIMSGHGGLGQLKKVFTMFYSYFNSQLGLLIRSGVVNKQLAKTNPALATALFTKDFLLVFAIPAILTRELFAGNAPDDEDWAHKYGIALLQYGLAMVPLVRDIGNYLLVSIDKELPNYGFKVTPVQSAGEGVVKGAVAVKDIAIGEGTDKDTKDAIMGVSYAFGLPGKLIANTVTGTKAIMEGEAGPKALIYGAPPETLKE